MKIKISPALDHCEPENLLLLSGERGNFHWQLSSVVPQKSWKECEGGMLVAHTTAYAGRNAADQRNGLWYYGAKLLAPLAGFENGSQYLPASRIINFT